MEPILMASAFVFLVGGNMLFNDDEGVDQLASEQVIENKLDSSAAPVGFMRGSFVRSKEGYYISNLTPEPIEPDGCDKPVLVADLSQPRTKQSLPVESISVGCGG